MKKAKIFDINVDLINVRELLNTIVDHAKNENKRVVVGNVNVKGLNIAYEEEKYSAFLKKCDTIFCDGIGVLIGLKLLGNKVSLDQRMTCPDYLDILLSMMIDQNLSIYFLAGNQTMISALDSKISKKYPQLKYGLHHGYFEKEGIENDKVLKAIEDFAPDILYVGFGMPIQEYWIDDNIKNINAKVILPLGACLDFYTGETYRGPKFLTSFGLEWLTRLFVEPRRLWRRYLIGNPIFLFRVLVSRLGIKKN